MTRVRLCIRELAQAKGMNMSQVQRQSGLTPSQIRRYWYSTQDGKRKGKPLTEVSLDSLGKLSYLLGVNPGDLLTNEPDER